MKSLVRIEKNKGVWFLLITSFIFFLLRLPSLFEPYWYGDEGIYQVIGYALRHGRLLYTGIWDNKPPMLYLIYALVNGNQTEARFLSLIAGLGAVWALFFLSKKLFVKILPAFIATGIFAFLFAIPLFEGNIANAENFMLLPGLLAGFLIWKALEQKGSHKVTFPFPRSTLYMTVAGFLLGFSFLIKVVALFDLSVFAAFFFIINLKEISVRETVEAVKKVIPLILGFLIPPLLCAGFFLATHTFSTFLKATLFSNVGYVNYGNQFIIPQGFLVLKTLLVGVVVLFFLLRRKYISFPAQFIFLWMTFSLYASLFSGRPYTHYALIMLPAFSLLVGLFFANKKLSLVTGISIAALIIFVSKAFSFYAHPFTYYSNFTQYIIGQKTSTAYQAFFDKIAPRDVAIAEFINTRRLGDQTIFVWGNSGQIYRLTNTLPPGRFIVAYHVTMAPANLAETKIALKQQPPAFVIVLPNQDIPPYSLAQYKEVLIINGATIYEHVL